MDEQGNPIIHEDEGDHNNKEDRNSNGEEPLYAQPNLDKVVKEFLEKNQENFLRYFCRKEDRLQHDDKDHEASSESKLS